MLKRIACCAVAALALAAGGAEIPNAVKAFVKDAGPLLAGAETFVLQKPGVYRVKDAAGKPLGTLYVETVKDDRRQMGYAGTIEVAIFADNDNRVAGVLLGRNQETPSYLNRVRKAGFLKSWNKLKLEEVPGKEVDTVTRATYSSGAILSGVRNLAAAQTVKTEPAEPPAAGKAEIVQLERRIAMLKRIVSGGKTLLTQLRTRKEEELQLRLTAAVEGPEAAKKFAEEHKMMFFNHHRRGAEKTPVELAAETYRADRSEANLATLKADILAEYEQLLESVPPHNAEQEKALAAAEARLAALKTK